MPWFDKALKSVQGTAEKAAFEADKLVRVQREQSALTEAQRNVQVKLAELGQSALELYRKGELQNYAIAGLAGEVDRLEDQIKQQQEKLEAVRNEQYGQQPAAPAQATPVNMSPPQQAPPQQAPSQPAVPAQPPSRAFVETEPAEMPASPPVEPPVVPSSAATTTMVECPSCHTQVKATAAFCPECGAHLK